jgi:hypothetical protein
LEADEDEQDEAARAAGTAFFDYGPPEKEDEAEEEADVAAGDTGSGLVGNA